MQNLGLPNLTSNFIFYKQQLWYYVFGLNNLANDDADLYVYKEIDRKRGSNDVISMLFDFFKNSNMLSYKFLTLVCDSCPDQNKNFGMIMFL